MPRSVDGPRNEVARQKPESPWIGCHAPCKLGRVTTGLGWIPACTSGRRALRSTANPSCKAEPRAQVARRHRAGPTTDLPRCSSPRSAVAGLAPEAAMSRTWRRYILAAGGLIVLAWGMYLAAGGWWYRAELARAKREIAAGRLGPRTRATGPTLGLPAGRGRGPCTSAALCEQAAGRPDRALAAWARIAPGSPFAATAARRQDEMLRQDPGRRPVRGTGRTPGRRPPRHRPGRGRGGPDPRLAPALRGPTRSRSGASSGTSGPGPRTPPARSASSGRSMPNRSRSRWCGASSTRAERQAPDDDRVWLGRANLATWSGRFDEADRWLDACLGRRPRDPAVWRARLDWARAAGRVDVGRRGPRAPAGRADSSPPRRSSSAPGSPAGGATARPSGAPWSACRAATPADARALERLATLAVEAGQADRAGELRRRKAELDRARDRYRKLLAIDGQDPDPRGAGPAGRALGRGSRPGAGGPWSPASRPTTARPAPPWTDWPAAPAPGSPADRSPTSSPPPTAPRGRSAPPRRRSSRPPSPTTPRRPGSGSPTTTAGPPLRQLPETMGGGVGLLDYDGDGWLDVYCRPGGPLPARRRLGPATGDRLFRNRGDGTFEDATEPSGIAGLAPAATATAWPSATTTTTADPDLFVTRWRSYALYRNQGDGTFEDATEAAGPGRRPRLADLGRLRRPRRRRRPRPLRLPLPRLGRRAPAALPRPRRPGRLRLLRPARLRRRCPTTSSATTAAGSST